METIRNCTILLLLSLFFFTYSNITEAKPVNGEAENYLAFAEQMPAPAGGIQEIYKKIVYPTLAKNAGVEGKVFVLAFINETGGVDDVKVLKGIGAGCDEAVIEAIKNSTFEPGKHQGQPVKVKLSLSFIFKLTH